MRIKIVAAVIYSLDKKQIFITQRPKDKHKGGFWEFPGGKVESGESTLQALSRELAEEIGIEVTKAHLLKQLDYDYPEKQLSFDFYSVTEFSGEPYGKEGQLGQWVEISDLNNYQFPEANQPIVELILQTT